MLSYELITYEYDFLDSETLQTNFVSLIYSLVATVDIKFQMNNCNFEE